MTGPRTLRQAVDAELARLERAYAKRGDLALAEAQLAAVLRLIEDEASSPAREGLREALTERWLARVEWNGNGSRAEWRCLVCGQYDRHRVDAEDYCPIAWVLASLSDPAPQR